MSTLAADPGEGVKRRGVQITKPLPLWKGLQDVYRVRYQISDVYLGGLRREMQADKGVSD